MNKLEQVQEKIQVVIDKFKKYEDINRIVCGSLERATLLSALREIKKDIQETSKIQNYSNNSILSEIKERLQQPNTQKEMVNHPNHYQGLTVNDQNVECIEAMEQLKGWFKTAAFCELNAFKYNWRIGEKDAIPQELGKIGWYGNKAKELWNNALHWLYPKNNHKYAIVDIGKIKMKNPTTREWQDAYLYTDGNGFYVRDSKDFKEKFEFINKYKQEE